MLETFKLLTGCDNDVLAKYYIDKAVQNIKDYTKRNTNTVKTMLKTYVIDLAVSYYNVKGAEGLQSQSYSGVSEHYLQDIPESIKHNLRAYRHFIREEELKP